MSWERRFYWNGHGYDSEWEQVIKPEIPKGHVAAEYDGGEPPYDQEELRKADVKSIIREMFPEASD